MIPVRFTPVSLNDLLEIGQRIARNNPHRAETFVSELESACLKLSEFPNIGKSRPDIGEGVRIKVHRQYIIIYRNAGRSVEILRAVQGMRDLAFLIDDLRDE